MDTTIARHSRWPALVRRLALPGLMVLSVLIACTPTPPAASVVAVSIDQGDLALLVGESTTLTVTVDVSGSVATSVAWSSDAEGVATVSDAGLVEAVSVGTAVITAASTVDPSKSDTVTVTVAAAPAVLSVSIDQADVALAVGGSSALTVTVDVVGSVATSVAWSSDAEGVATVSDAGLVEAVSVGTAVITAASTADPSKFDTVTVTVTPATEGATIDGLTATVVLGSLVDLAWTATNADAIDVACLDGAIESAIETLAGSASGTTIEIPVSTCQTIRVTARAVTGDANAEVTLENVVLNGDDDGPGSLRSVIAGIAGASDAVVGFAADVTEVVLSAVELVVPNDAHLIFPGDVVVSGPSGSLVTIRSDDSLASDPSGAEVLRSRLFYVPAGVQVRLDGLLLTGGTFIGVGGAIRNDGDLLISNSLLEGNRAWYAGGAVHNRGTLDIVDSTLRDNEAVVTDSEAAAPFLCVGDATRSCEPTDDNYIGPLASGGAGGAVYNLAGTAMIEGSTIESNRAKFSGGGVYVEGGTVTLIDTTVLTNLASDVGFADATTSYGGGVFNAASFVMQGGSVEANEAADFGGGLSNGFDAAPDLPMDLTDVTVTGNVTAGFGGGAINFYTTVTTNLQELGATSIVGNTADIDGPNRYDSIVVIAPAPDVVAPRSLTAPTNHTASPDQLRR